ncbi:MAG: hypothetical protein AB1721_00170 [Patescibacteria group bacterium]
MEGYKILAKILRTDQDIIKNLEQKTEKITGKTGVLDKVISENQSLIEKKLISFGLNPNRSLKQIVLSLLNRVKKDEEKISQLFSGLNLASQQDCQKILEFADKLLGFSEGYFLKKEKAKELLRNKPPENILKFLGYSDIEQALANEDLFELFASLRFGESNQWLNREFFKQYESLTPADFEKRKIHYFAFSEKFAPLAKEFIAKKYHNLSHLKELGTIFIVPTEYLIGPGQLMKIFSLSFHYFYEVKFYSELIEKYSGDSNFKDKLVSLLRGDVAEPKINLKTNDWLVTQRYLEKDDSYEIGLIVPHINPESIHWSRAQNRIAKINPEFEFWHNLDWVGGYFEDEIGADTLVSFNLVDLAMSLADKDKKVFYTYHQREALWNKIFQEYFGEEALEKLAKENIISARIKF